MYDLHYSQHTREQIKKLDHSMQERVLLALERIRIRPEAFVRRMVNDPAYRLRIGDYRAILDIDKNHNVVLVLRVGHRKNVYD